MKLTDTQTTVLEAAARNEGRVSEFPESVKGGARAAVLKGLVGRGLVAPEGDGHDLTDAGYAAIGRKPEATKTKPRRTGTKKATILELLKGNHKTLSKQPIPSLIVIPHIQQQLARIFHAST